MNRQGKVALVTGASRGIGRAVALRLANDGAGVVVNHAGSEKRGGQAVAVRADVSKVADVVAMLCTKEARWVNGHNVRANGGRSEDTSMGHPLSSG